MGAGFCRCNFFIWPVWRPPDCGNYFRRDLGLVFMGLFRPAAADGRQFDFVADGVHRRDYAAVAAADETTG